MKIEHQPQNKMIQFISNITLKDPQVFIPLLNEMISIFLISLLAEIGSNFEPYLCLRYTRKSGGSSMPSSVNQRWKSGVAKNPNCTVANSLQRSFNLFAKSNLFCQFDMNITILLFYMFKHSSDADILKPITNYRMDNTASQPLAPTTCLYLSTKLRKEVLRFIILTKFLHAHTKRNQNISAV